MLSNLLNRNKNNSNRNSNSNLDSLFYPKSIAVVGASNDKSKIGGFIFSEILKSKNIDAIPINVKWENIQNKKAYTNITEVNKKIDLVIIAIPSKFVIDSILDCVKVGIKNIVIITAGFKEIGEEGRARENELKKIIKEYNLNIIGPNCLGFLNPEINLNCSFAKDIPEFGNIALISQSGAIIDAIIDWSFKEKIGFSKIVSLGNMAGVDELSILNYLKNDPKTNAIVFYMETLEKGNEFAKVLNEVSRIKPVIIIKPGNSNLAKKAIGSHTGSLAQNNVLVKTLIEENNGILVSNLDELFNLMIALKTKTQTNNNLVILTNAGGPGVIGTDAVAKSSFNLYKLSDNEKNNFDFLPKEASLNNPIDILGDAKSDRYLNVLKNLNSNKNINNILVLLTPQIMTDSENIANSIVEFSKNSDKLIATSFLGDKEIKSAIKILNSNNIANFTSPTSAINSLDKLYKWKNFNYIDENFKKYNFNMNLVNEIRKELENTKGLLDFNITRRIFEEILAIRLPSKQIVRNFDDIDNIKLEDNKKYVLKADAKEFVHKKELGGVVLGVDKNNFDYEIHKLFDILFENASSPFSITIEEEVNGSEVILGLKNEGELGNFIMFGSGGTYVSVYEDIKWSKCPLNRESTKRLVNSVKISKILNGFRGSKPIHFDHLYEIMVRISYLQELFPEIKEVDLNPIIVNETGVYLVDIKLII